MQKIQFLGACGEVTGSNYIVTAHDGSQVMVDFGIFQGSKEISELNYEPLRFSPSKIKGVFLTHAHLDHCGRLPLLVYGGFFGKIYMTAPTRALIEIVLTDSAKIAKENMDHSPLYSEDQVTKVLDMVEIVEYDKPISVGSFNAVFKDAGHILGSASIKLTDNSSDDKDSIVFSGDLGNSPEDIVKPTEYFSEANYVVMESTYGDSEHPKEDISLILQEEINAVENKGGVLLIPAFSLERTQELLHRIYHLKQDGKVSSDTPVFLDSPMGIHATEIFSDFRNFYNSELQAHQDDPFYFEGLVITEDARHSKEIIKAMEPKVIIAGSGMMSGGRILHHAFNYLDKPTTHVLFVGYQAEETLGRAILEGKKSVVINDKSVLVKANLREIKSMSSHADQQKLIDWLKHLNKVKKVFLVHGDTNQRNVFTQVAKQVGVEDVLLPENGQEFPL